MITVGSISREDLAGTFPFVAARFRGRRAAIKELTHARPDFVFWIFPDGRLHDAKDAHARNVPKGHEHILKDEPDYGGFLRGRIVSYGGRQLVVVYCRPEALAEPGPKLAQFLAGIRDVPVPLGDDAVVISDNADIYGTLANLGSRQDAPGTPGSAPEPDPFEAEVLSHFRSGGALRAILHIRQSRNLGLAQATRLMRSITERFTSAQQSTGEVMGMSAELFAVGPFSISVCGRLDYRPEYYAQTREGAIVTRRLFGIVEGSSVSRELAALLGITDPWDFNQHKLDMEKVDVPALREWASKYPDYASDVDALFVLAEAGFEIHFRPEG